MNAPQTHDEYIVEDQPAGVRLRGAMLASMAMDPPPRGPNAGLFAERMASMAEPSSSAFGGFALWKLFGGLAGFAAIGAGLSAVVVMCMMTPRNPREWAVGLISTVMFSIGGGSALIEHWHLQTWAHSTNGLLALLGLVFACGLPGWAIVRGLFTFFAKRADKGLDEIVADARRVVTP